jgi:hypothetical protein
MSVLLFLFVFLLGGVCTVAFLSYLLLRVLERVKGDANNELQIARVNSAQKLPSPEEELKKTSTFVSKETVQVGKILISSSSQP